MSISSGVRRLFGKATQESPQPEAEAVVYARAGFAGGDERVLRSLPRLWNSLALMMGRVSTLALGFLSWLLAARLFPPAEVGLASGAISAMMLCVQLALLGVGSAFISLFPQHQRRPTALLDTAFMVVTATSLLAASLFLVLASGVFHELSVVGTRPMYTLLFLALSALGTIGVLFDHVSIASRRSDQVLSRNVLFGLITLASMAVLSLLFGATSSLAIFSAWVMGNLGACMLGCIQLWRALARYRWRARVKWDLTRQLLTIGFPNYLLTLAERAPGSIMPIVVIELLSPVANAYWYPVWMMGWGVLIIPISIGQTLFAEAAHRPESLGDEVRHSLRSSLAFGFLAAAGAALLAPFMLSLLGPDYAAAGTTPLRILVIGVLPFAFIQAYYSACRARRRLREAVLTGLFSGVGSVGGAAVVGVSYGIVGIAVAWVVAQFATGLWASWRLLVIARQEQSEANS